MSAPLTFEWDEWTLLAGMASGQLWLLQEHIDNFFPVGRALFWLETQAFGSAYAPYVLVNLALLFATSAGLCCVLGRLTGSRTIAGLLATLYVIAHGQYYNVFWAMQGAWFLAMLFTALLLVRVSDLNRSIGDLGNVFLIGLIWLSMASTLVAVPGLVATARVLRRAREGPAFNRSDAVGFMLTLLLCIELLAIARLTIQSFPPPHAGARASIVALSDRLSRPAQIGAEGLVGHAFFTSAPLIPGALTMFGQRVKWDPLTAWLAAKPWRIGAAIPLALAMSAAMWWRVRRWPSRERRVSLWLGCAAVVVWAPVVAATVARSALFGPPLTPRYDTWLVFASLIAVSALLQIRTNPATQRWSQTERPPASTSSPACVRLGTTCVLLIFMHVCWLGVRFEDNLGISVAGRSRKAEQWKLLGDRCGTDEGRSGLSIPADLQPGLSATEYCSIIEYLGAR